MAACTGSKHCQNLATPPYQRCTYHLQQARERQQRYRQNKRKRSHVKLPLVWSQTVEKKQVHIERHIVEHPDQRRETKEIEKQQMITVQQSIMMDQTKKVEAIEAAVDGKTLLANNKEACEHLHAIRELSLSLLQDLGKRHMSEVDWNQRQSVNSAHEHALLPLVHVPWSTLNKMKLEWIEIGEILYYKLLWYTWYKTTPSLLIEQDPDIYFPNPHDIYEQDNEVLQVRLQLLEDKRCCRLQADIQTGDTQRRVMLALGYHLPIEIICAIAITRGSIALRDHCVSILHQLLAETNQFMEPM